MRIRQWLDAVEAAWARVSCASELSEWLRRDIGLTEDDLRSRSEHIDEIRRKYREWM
jgi:hypothetical protein